MSPQPIYYVQAIEGNVLPSNLIDYDANVMYRGLLTVRTARHIYPRLVSEMLVVLFCHRLLWIVFYWSFY